MEIVFNLLVIGFVALIAYWWANQGVLSALLHLIAVIAAGALAFAGWEPISHKLLAIAALQPYAWGIGLMLPFALYLLVLRILSDKLAPDNLNFPQYVNLALGGALGVAAAVITLGIAIIGAGHTHSSNKILNVAGASRTSNSRGQPTLASSPLWVPVHSITSGLYETLSTGSMRPTLSAPTLASEQPSLDTQALGLFRDTYAKDGRIARVAAPVGAITITRAILVPDFEVPGVATTRAYVVDVHLESGATTPGQGFAISASQFRLVGKARGTTGPGSGIAYPIAWSQPKQDGGRGVFVFDDRSHYVSGPAGTQTLDVSLIFPADSFAQGDAPRFMQTMGLRLPFPKIDAQSTLADALAMVMGSDTGVAPVIPEDIGTVNGNDLSINDTILPASADTNSMPGSMKLQDGNYLFEGTGDFEQGGYRGNKSVVVKGVWARGGTRIVRLNVSRGGSSSIDIWGDRNKLRERVGDTAKLALVDELGREYLPIGFIHITSSGDKRVTIELDRNGRYAEVGQYPTLSTSGADTLYALFSPAINRRIVGVKLGGEWLAKGDLLMEEKR